MKKEQFAVYKKEQARVKCGYNNDNYYVDKLK